MPDSRGKKAACGGCFFSSLRVEALRDGPFGSRRAFLRGTGSWNQGYSEIFYEKYILRPIRTCAERKTRIYKAPHYGDVAQLGERSVRNAEVVSSILIVSTSLKSTEVRQGSQVLGGLYFLSKRLFVNIREGPLTAVFLLGQLWGQHAYPENSSPNPSKHGLPYAPF